MRDEIPVRGPRPPWAPFRRIQGENVRSEKPVRRAARPERLLVADRARLRPGTVVAPPTNHSECVIGSYDRRRRAESHPGTFRASDRADIPARTTPRRPVDFPHLNFSIERGGQSMAGRVAIERRSRGSVRSPAHHEPKQMHAAEAQTRTVPRHQPTEATTHPRPGDGRSARAERPRRRTYSG